MSRQGRRDRCREQFVVLAPMMLFPRIMLPFMVTADVLFSFEYDAVALRRRIFRPCC